MARARRRDELTIDQCARIYSRKMGVSFEKAKRGVLEAIASGELPAYPIDPDTC